MLERMRGDILVMLEIVRGDMLVMLEMVRGDMLAMLKRSDVDTNLNRLMFVGGDDKRVRQVDESGGWGSKFESEEMKKRENSNFRQHELKLKIMLMCMSM